MIQNKNNNQLTANKNLQFNIMLIGPDETVIQLISKALSQNAEYSFSDRFDDHTAASSYFRKNPIDCVIIDIGDKNTTPLTTIRRLRRIDPEVKILVASTLSISNVRIGLKALLEGASEYIQTPAKFTKNKSFAIFQNKFIKTLNNLCNARRQAGSYPQLKAIKKPTEPTDKIKLVPASPFRPEVIAIGSSTGGPPALHIIFAQLPESFNIPLLITQHMPPSFTPLLAQNLAKKFSRDVAEGKDGEEIVKGRIYIAPGDKHMVTKKINGKVIISLNEDPTENSCRPSVDPLFRSIAKNYGNKALAVVLTGMGYDGGKSAVDIAAAGGTVIAQDFKTSIVWGMPGAAANSGSCSAVLPLDKIVPYILDKLK